jgi:hypothetical protein
MEYLKLAQNNLETAKSNLVYRLKNPIDPLNDWFYIVEGEEDISKWRNIVRRIREE